jgi:arylsulfatase A-like enzyme
MKTRFNLLFICLIALGMTTSHAAETPNIILILVDNLGRESIGCYGGNHATPNIDKLAREGVRYETVWSMPACTPSLVTLLTGQYPFRHGWTQHDDVARLGGEGLNGKRFTTVAKCLREGGYQTAVGGHWLINHLSTHPGALQEHGFQEHCVWSNTEPEQTGKGTRNLNPPLLINGKYEKVVNGAARINAFLTEFATRERKQPFFIYYPMLLASVPSAESKETRPQRSPENTSLRATNIKRVDQLVGNLIKAVDNNSLQDKTIILLTGINVPAIANETVKRNRDQEHTRASDRGVRVPLIVRASKIEDGRRVSRDLIDFTDFYPTFMQLAGIKSPESLVLDGRSFVPSLRGSEDPYQKRSWIYSQLGGIRMIRDWKHLIDTNGSFHDLLDDPLQQEEVNPLDKIAPGRRQRLQMILDRFPENAASPFPEYSRRHSSD